MSLTKRIGAIAVVASLAAIGIAALPHPAEAWWRGPWCCRVGIGLWVPPVGGRSGAGLCAAARVLRAPCRVLSGAAARLGAGPLERPRLGAGPPVVTGRPAHRPPRHMIDERRGVVHR
jgi:hypothetical protein